MVVKKLTWMLLLPNRPRQRRTFLDPLPIVWMDAVVDEVQFARAAVGGAEAVTLNLETLGVDRCNELKSVAEDKYGLEALIVCAPRAAGAEGLVPLMQQARDDVKASVLVVGGVAFDAMASAVKEMKSEDLVLIARVDARDDQGLEEAEEAWDLRDAGYDAVWVSDVLYKFGSFSGNLFASSPDTITSVVKAMKSKASTKFAGVRRVFGQGRGRQGVPRGHPHVVGGAGCIINKEARRRRGALVSPEGTRRTRASAHATPRPGFLTLACQRRIRPVALIASRVPRGPTNGAPREDR